MGPLTVEEFEHAGLKVEVRMEEYVEEFDNPREFDGNVGVMLCSHRSYNLGDEQISGDDYSTEVDCPECGGTGETDRFEVRRYSAFGWTVEAGPFDAKSSAEDYARNQQTAANDLSVDLADCAKCEGTGQIELPLDEYLRKERGARVILPLGLYDHSGISMYVGGRHAFDSAGWDSGQVGVIFDTEETRKECGLADDVSDETIERQLHEEVELYDAYLRGEVYYYIVEDDDGETLGGCGGFLADLDYCTEQAKEEAEHCAAQIEREKEEAAHWAARDTVTVP